MLTLLTLLCAPTLQEPQTFPVFLLAGQSNMEGQAVVDLDHEQHYNGGRGNLQSLYKDPKLAERLAHLKDGEGWRSRDDVFVWYRAGQREELLAGPLSVGYAVYGGTHHFGPELEFGHQVGDLFDEPVLLIKTAWGGKSLQRDFRPPSAVGDTGPYYERMLREYSEALADARERFPLLADREPVLKGFVWFQGWNDMVDDEASEAYADNLAHLIRDVRRDLAAPQLPVVVGETGNAAKESFRAAQRAGATREEFKGTVTFVPTTSFLRKAEDSPNTTHGHHWYGNAMSYFLIGEAFGKAMRALLEED
ncbi:MAG: sialate O-acetylesterase [Planctomycetota bacterium]|nr:sialate O-acetylesterase [Planctomycetota bacterium]